MQEEFTYEIVPKKVKNYTIRINAEGKVTVTMPLYGSRKRAENLVAEKRSWIIKKLSEMEEKVILHTGELRFKWEDEDRLIWVTEQMYKRFFQYGIPMPKLSFRKMTGRWGSCEKRKAAVTLNKMLKYVPAECQEYVAAHELAHLVEANHSSAFYEVLDSVMPDHRKREKMLKHYVLQQ